MQMLFCAHSINNHFLVFRFYFSKDSPSRHQPSRQRVNESAILLHSTSKRSIVQLLQIAIIYTWPAKCNCSENKCVPS